MPKDGKVCGVWLDSDTQNQLSTLVTKDKKTFPEATASSCVRRLIRQAFEKLEKDTSQKKGTCRECVRFRRCTEKTYGESCDSFLSRKGADNAKG